MTPEQALQILDDAAARAQMTRQDHILVAQAVENLRALIEKTKVAANGQNGNFAN